jgi:aldehyde:ferredoxin oxidoreductase
MSNCLVTYECRSRGCYAESVGMAMTCPGVASREATEAAKAAETLEAEIAAAKVRLGYGPQDPVWPPALVEQELPEELRQPFWRRQVEKHLTMLEAKAGITTEDD